MWINNTLVCWDEVTCTILMCHWFSYNLIPVYWCVIDSHGTAFQHSDVLTILVWPYSSILKYCWFSGDLKYCWLSGDLILAYWCVIDSRVTLFQHTEVLLILMVPHSAILMCYWFSCDLIPAYWCVNDSHGNKAKQELLTRQNAGMQYHENQ
jgi:hypothetical protein